MRLLLGLLLFSINASGQDIFLFKDSSVVKTLEDLPSQEPFDTSHAYNRAKQKYIYLFSDNDLHRIFDYSTAMKYWQFDFANHHILGKQVCRQCLSTCHHDEGEKACHRNRCQYEWTWEMRENKKTFLEIPSTTKKGHVDTKLPKDRHSFFGDTIIRSTKDSVMLQWYTHSGGDCFARFRYDVVYDKYHSVVLLKERNYWGGCRAGGSWTFTIAFAKPETVVQYSKNIILMEKYGEGQDH